MNPPGFSFFSVVLFFPWCFSFSPCPLTVGVPRVLPNSNVLLTEHVLCGWLLSFTWCDILMTPASLTPGYTCTPDSRLIHWPSRYPFLNAHLLLNMIQTPRFVLLPILSLSGAPLVTSHSATQPRLRAPWWCLQSLSHTLITSRSSFVDSVS